MCVCVCLCIVCVHVLYVGVLVCTSCVLLFPFAVSAVTNLADRHMERLVTRCVC